MTSQCTKRKVGADDDDDDYGPDKRISDQEITNQWEQVLSRPGPAFSKNLSEQKEGSKQKPGFQRPGPACSKRRTLEANERSQLVSVTLRSRTANSLGAQSSIRQTTENQPVSPSQNLQDTSQSSSVEEVPSTQPVLPPPISSPTSTSTSSPPEVQDAATNELPTEESPKTLPSGSKTALADEHQLIMLVRKFPVIYNTKDRTNRGKLKKLEAWRAISKEMGNITMKSAKDKWRSIREKYCRAKKQLVDEGQIPARTMEFINNLNFLTYQRRSGIKHKKMTVTSVKRKQSNQSKLRSTSQSTLKATPPKIQDNGPKPDQPFADDIAAALQRFSPEQKYVLKAKFWQVLAEFGSRP